MSFVFVVDTNKQPLNPIHPGHARLLLKAGKAVVLKRYPFTLILKASVQQPQIQPLRLKLDPGSRTTGIAIVNDQSGQVLFAAELSHRGDAIKVECGSGGLTKFNRVSRGLEKTHWLDAACVGQSTPSVLQVKQIKPLLIKATGHGKRQMCLMDKRGFPRTNPKEAKKVKGFQTGDMVRAVVTKGTKAGTYVGKVAIRATGSFNITTKTGTVQGISHRFCTPLHRCDGYSY